MQELKTLIRNVPDFPKKGIGFKDITTLLKQGDAFRECIDAMAARFSQEDVDAIAGIEARGFIFGAALAYKWSKPFIPIRKPGKLPAEVLREEYELEYGTDAIEMHKDAVVANQRVLIVDDLLATGGTVVAACKLVEKAGGRIAGIGFLIELAFLKGMERLERYRVETLISFHSE
jgi:adenine phosphoribosyltransferase